MKIPSLFLLVQVSMLFLGFISTLQRTQAASPSVELLQQSEWPGGPRGSVYDVVVSGQYAFVALGTSGLGVVDISDPTNAVYVGGRSNIGSCYRLAVQGNYLYVAGRQTGLHIVDISNPLRLKRIGGALGTYVSTVAISGSHVYTTGQFSGLQVFGVSDPANCRKVGGLDTIPASSVAVAGDRAYVVGTDGLRVIDVSDPGNCVVLGGFEAQYMNGAGSPAIYGSLVYVPAGGGVGFGLHIIDTSEPTNCVRVGTYDNGGLGAWRVRRFGNRLYLEQHSVHLNILDISNPTNAVRIGGISRPGLNDGVAVSGNYAYFGNFYEGLDVLDVSDPTNCTRIGQVGIGGETHDVAPLGRYTLVADGEAGLQILQTDTGFRPTRIGNLRDINRRTWATSVAAVGNLAFVGTRANGMWIVDVSNPTNCVLAGSCVANWTANKVAVSDGFAYVASSSGLQVIDVRNPSTCVIVRSGIVASPASDAQILGNYLYLAGHQGLHIVDIRNPTNSARVGGWKQSITNLIYPALAVAWPYVYLASDIEGFNVIHAGNPTNCVRVGGYTSADFPVNDVSLLGHYALVLNAARREIRVFDVSNPSNCVFVTSFKTGGPTRDINVINGEVFLANGVEGLVVIPSVLDVHNTLRVDATPNVPFTVEAATSLSDPSSWQPLLTTNVTTTPFDFVDFDVKITDKPRKFYRVRQP